MYKIGIIGDKDSVLGFLAVGFTVMCAENSKEALEHLRDMANNREKDPQKSFAVIYITENYAEELENEIAVYRDRPIPAIIAIPSKSGRTGYGMANIKKSVEHAVGADIL